MKWQAKELNDVKAFHAKMLWPMPGRPQLMRPEDMAVRVRMLQEEVGEIDLAFARGDLVKVVDGLLDLIYFAHGTLDWCGVCGDTYAECWDAVHDANMKKEPGSTNRGVFDAVKPGGWVSPDEDIRKILQAHGAEV